MHILSFLMCVCVWCFFSRCEKYMLELNSPRWTDTAEGKIHSFVCIADEYKSNGMEWNRMGKIRIFGGYCGMHWSIPKRECVCAKEQTFWLVVVVVFFVSRLISLWYKWKWFGFGSFAKHPLGLVHCSHLFIVLNDLVCFCFLIINRKQFTI